MSRSLDKAATAPLMRCKCGGERFITASGLCCWSCGARVAAGNQVRELRRLWPERVIHCSDVVKFKV
jgi:hypothetical protein